jgi:hypothetical protein
MNCEELIALTEKAEHLAAEGERLRRKHQALLKKVAELSKEQGHPQQKPTKNSFNGFMPLISQAFQPRSKYPRPD